jgi:hypothetical protein
MQRWNESLSVRLCAKNSNTVGALYSLTILGILAMFNVLFFSISPGTFAEIFLVQLMPTEVSKQCKESCSSMLHPQLSKMYLLNDHVPLVLDTSQQLPTHLNQKIITKFSSVWMGIFSIGITNELRNTTFLFKSHPFLYHPMKSSLLKRKFLREKWLKRKQKRR